MPARVAALNRHARRIPHARTYPRPQRPLLERQVFCIRDINWAFALSRLARTGARNRRVRALEHRWPSWSKTAHVAPELSEDRLVIADLGNGASCARSTAAAASPTTMAFTAIDGLPMGTRCGAWARSPIRATWCAHFRPIGCACGRSRPESISPRTMILQSLNGS